jgi:hypothetical protein
VNSSIVISARWQGTTENRRPLRLILHFNVMRNPKLPGLRSNCEKRGPTNSGTDSCDSTFRPSLDPVDAYRKGIDQIETLCMLGQNGVEWARTPDIFMPDERDCVLFIHHDVARRGD